MLVTRLSVLSMSPSASDARIFRRILYVPGWMSVLCGLDRAASTNAFVLLTTPLLYSVWAMSVDVWPGSTSTCTSPLPPEL